MGKNHFTNWTTGCQDSCGNGTVCADCGCDTCAGDCGCANNCGSYTPANDCGCANVNSCGCNTAAPASGCANTGNCGCNTTASTCGCNAASACGYANANSGGAQDGTHIYYETCDGFKEISITGACRQDAAPGRVLDVNATLLGVCPGRRSALGFALTEVDGNGAEHACGFQSITVPAHNGSCNQDVQCETVRFILPEDQCLQARRHFVVRTHHHYLDASNVWNNGWGGGCK